LVNSPRLTWQTSGRCAIRRAFEPRLVWTHPIAPREAHLPSAAARPGSSQLRKRMVDNLDDGSCDDEEIGGSEKTRDWPPRILKRSAVGATAIWGVSVGVAI
jgi:hypothetical protein